MEFYTPKNFKNGKFIFNRFRKVDLLIFGIGLGMTFLLFYITIALLIVLHLSIIKAILMLLCSLLPLGIASLFVLIPTSVKHNFFEVIKILVFYQIRKKEILWGGVQHFESEKE